MSTPTGADGGFFAGPPPQQPTPPGYGVPGQFVAAPPSRQAQTAPAGPAPFVVGSITSLVIAGVAATWVGLSMLTVVSSFGGFGVTGGFGVGGGFGGRGAFLLLNGLLDLGLAYPLLRGVEPARWAATAVCGFWTLYWLYEVTRAAQAFSDIGLAPAGFGFGRLTFMATLGLLLLAVWAAATGALLWLSSATRHFRH